MKVTANAPLASDDGHSRGAQHSMVCFYLAGSQSVGFAMQHVAECCGTLCQSKSARAHTFPDPTGGKARRILKVRAQVQRVLAFSQTFSRRAKSAPNRRMHYTEDLTTAAAAAPVWPLPSQLHVQLPSKSMGHTVGSTGGQSIFGHSPCTAASRNDASPDVRAAQSCPPNVFQFIGDTRLAA